MEIDIYLDHVVIEGQRVQRPHYISRMDWELNWLLARFRMDQGCPHYKCPVMEDA